MPTSTQSISNMSLRRQSSIVKDPLLEDSGSDGESMPNKKARAFDKQDPNYAGGYCIY